jgi:hypothetical protein
VGTKVTGAAWAAAVFPAAARANVLGLWVDQAAATSAVAAGASEASSRG